MSRKSRSKDWRNWVYKKAKNIFRKNTTPLPVKEAAWRMLNFAVACGQSNPLSYVLRPIADHKHLRRVVGLNLVILAAAAAFWAPLPSMASDTGGVPTVVLPEGEAMLKTEEAVVWPIPSRQISQGFWLLHAGVDIRTPVGTPVNPVMAGRVTETEVSRYGYGEKVVLSHRNGYSTLYAHLSEIDVKVGDEVTTESVVGLSGNTGRSTGPHLHLEIHNESGQPINPLSVLGDK